MVEESSGPDLELAQAKVATAADARRRLRREREVTAAESTLRGVLDELAAVAAPLALATEHGRLRGTAVEVGADCLRVETSSGQTVLVRLAAVVAVEAGDGQPVTGVTPRGSSSIHLADVLAGFAATDVPLTLVCRGGRRFDGTVSACGVDIATLRLRGGATSSYVALDSVNEVWSSSIP